jgi:hypothetical protein
MTAGVTTAAAMTTAMTTGQGRVTVATTTVVATVVVMTMETTPGPARAMTTDDYQPNGW